MIQRQTCPTCGQTFQPGYDGMNCPKGCDVCLKVTRDTQGFAWLPGQMVDLRRALDIGRNTRVITVTREQAFKNNFTKAFPGRGEG